MTATADKSEAATPASRSAAATTSSMAALCASCARLGTTPPHGAWIASCDALASPSTRPSPVTTAAPVSSHEVSMPKMRVSAPRDTTRPSGPSRSGESGPEPNPVAAPVRPSMRARRSGLSGRTPPAANPRRWEGLGRNERRAAGRKPRAGADAGIDDARAPHVAVVTLTEARAARIAARIVFTAAAVARQPTRLAECPVNLQHLNSFFPEQPSRFGSNRLSPCRPSRSPRQEVHRQEAKGRQVQMGHRSAPEEEGHDPFAGPALQEGREESVGATLWSVRLRLK